MAVSNVLAKRRANTLRMVQTALFAALEVILTLVTIQVGTINMNFGLVPIVLAGIFLSPLSGALIGLVSGFVTMIQVLSGQGIFYVFLIANNPVAAALLCLVKTTAAGFLAGLVYQGISKICKNFSLSTLVAAMVCPIVNTGIFAAGMFIFFGEAIMNDPEISSWNPGGLIGIVFVALIGVNFFVELALNMVLCPALSEALRSTKFFKK